MKPGQNYTLSAVLLAGLVLAGCHKDQSAAQPMTAEDQIENSGIPRRFLSGEYFTHALDNYSGKAESSDDPEGYGIVSVVRSRYFLTLAPKGSDSLSVKLAGTGEFGMLDLNLGTFGIQLPTTPVKEYTLISKKAGLKITRVIQASNTLYISANINFVNSRNENTGWIRFRRVSKGIVG